MIVGLLGIFGSKLLILFLMSAFHSFLSKCSCHRQRQAMVTLKIRNSGLDRLSIAHFLTLCHCYFGLTHTLGATGLNQPADRCVKLRRQVLLTSLQSRGENRLWLRSRKYTTIFTLCVEQWFFTFFVSFTLWQNQKINFTPNNVWCVKSYPTLG